MSNKRGQVGLFVIIAVILVASVALISYFGVLPFGVTGKIAPVEDKVLDCLAQTTKQGTEILGEQGGYITPPAFEPGSEYAPFTSQINFFGSVMPYWFYLSGNGIYREQIPTLKMMQDQLSDYVRTNAAANCDLSTFESQGYLISIEEPTSITTDIRTDKVFVDAVWPITVEYQGASRRITAHSTTLTSSFGRLYDLAQDVYTRQKATLFLEDYTIDVLTLYAPGTDVELTCSPKIWKKSEVVGGITQALHDNIPTIKLEGDYYKIADSTRNYFVKDLNIPLKGEQVNFLYDRTFPTKVEIDPSSGEFLRADPIGNQEGIGIIGFCYVPYHFVYNVAYPVIVQVFDKDYGLFQFPIIVSVENNAPHGAIPAESPGEILESPLCQYPNQPIDISTIDLNGRSVDADISLKCDNAECHIGKTLDGELSTNVPQCVNGYLIARAENYTDAKALVSTNEAQSAQVVMKPRHTIDIVVLKDLVRLESDESAMIVFSSEDNAQSIFYPTQQTVELSDGNYKVTSYLFKSGKIVLQAQNIQQCVNVPRSGVFGFLGFEREECYTLSQPAQELNQITIGGGATEVTLEEDDLRSASFVGVEIGSQPVPRTVLDLQDVYTSVANSGINVVLK